MRVKKHNGEWVETEATKVKNGKKASYKAKRKANLNSMTKAELIGLVQELEGILEL